MLPLNFTRAVQSSSTPFQMIFLGSGRLALQGVLTAQKAGYQATIIGSSIPDPIKSLDESIVKVYSSDHFISRLGRDFSPESPSQIQVVECSREKFSDGYTLSKILKAAIQNFSGVTHVINTRSIASRDNTSTVYRPVTQASQAIAEAFKGKEDSVVSINFSSTVASYEGLEKICNYSASRKPSDEMFIKTLKERGIAALTLRTDFVEPSRLAKDFIGGDNHGCSFPELIQLLRHPVPKFNQSIFALQPIQEQALIDTLVDPNLLNRINQLSERQLIVDAVGPKAYTIEESYELWGRHFGIKFKPIEIDRLLFQSAADKIGFAQMIYGSKMMHHKDLNPHLNKPLSHDLFQYLHGKPLLSIDDVHLSERTQGEIFMPPCKIITKLSENFISSFKKEPFNTVSTFIPHLPRATLLALRKLMF